MSETLLDDFEDLSRWSTVASGLAQLEIKQDSGPRGKALRLDFDFHGGAGFVVARREAALALPEQYSFSFDIRGAAPPNNLEFKLADTAGHNVWWYRDDAFEFPRDWRRVRIRSSQIHFAWGPAGGGAPSQIGAIEIAIAAGPGGKGTVWIDDLRITDETFYGLPVVHASSFVAGREPERAVDGRRDTSWRAQSTDDAPWLVLDFGRGREYGGLILDWETARRARKFRTSISNDGTAWETVYATTCAGAERTYLHLPGTVSRFLRFELSDHGGDEPLGIVDVGVEPYEFGRSSNDFFYAVAEREPLGHFPRYFRRQQTYWTTIGLPDGETCAIMNEDGMVEVDRATFSIEPFLCADGRLWTWADARAAQALERGCLPVPTSAWQVAGVELAITTFAERVAERAVLYVRYRIRNTEARSRDVRLYAVLRPFQVTPPWQAYHELGGVSAISHVTRSGDTMRVNRRRTVTSLTKPSHAGMAAFDEGDVAGFLDAIPERDALDDATGYGSAALGYALHLEAFETKDVFLAAPFGESDEDVPAEALLSNGRAPAAQFERAVRAWDENIGGVKFVLPESARAYGETFRTAAGQVLACRDGSALQPGPRRYARSWIRDGAVMAAALLRAACAPAALEFVRWYAGFQAPNGNVPCAVDRSGPDWLAEHDSHGELIFAAMDCYRFTGDHSFLEEMWPVVRKAVAYIESLRAQRVTGEYRVAAKRACHGLLPESASHEGYLAHPVHAYWDDFWALRGLGDAAEMAELVGDHDEAQLIASARDSLRAALAASIEMTMRERQIDTIPASVEWADFDPTATANAVSLLDETDVMPRAALERTFDVYLDGVRRRRSGEIEWAKYAPYEIRIAAALIRLGRRDTAHELMEYFMSDRRPSAWNQWPEIAWRDPRSPGHAGDMPHAWIGAEYMLVLRDMFAYECETQQTLVLAAGIPGAWLDDGFEVGVADLPSAFGTLGVRVRRGGEEGVVVTLSGTLSRQPRRIVLRPPLAGRLVAVTVDGRAVETFDGDSATIETWPAVVRMRSAR